MKLISCTSFSWFKQQMGVLAAGLQKSKFGKCTPLPDRPFFPTPTDIHLSDWDPPQVLRAFSQSNNTHSLNTSKFSGVTAMSKIETTSLLSWNSHSTREGEAEITNEMISQNSVTRKIELMAIEWLQSRAWQTFSVKSQRVNSFSFVGCRVCVTTTQLTCCRMQAATDNM